MDHSLLGIFLFLASFSARVVRLKEREPPSLEFKALYRELYKEVVDFNEEGMERCLFCLEFNKTLGLEVLFCA